ncbi:MAG: phosphate signaling complex protein PhoU [Oscillospiraceae bacterium]|nr:phosphate signaling complex protein PhoU [Oscillospiraceae bacterium]MDD6085896.1 phosphate signaling complex protein PhoU [Oscillospiraceae bacterium]MDY3257167.1 phosphate signaling complex protein PhoU [Ruminococcus callidus]
MRDLYVHQLSVLNSKLIEMGELCENAIQSSVKALLDGNTAAAKAAASLDDEIDHKEREIESICLKLILSQQPVAGDLRQISSALKMITDMERIGDQAADIAEIVPHLKGHTPAECVGIKNMSEEVIKMVTSSIDAYVKKDIELAQRVIKNDDIVDDYFLKIKSSLVDVISEKKQDGEYAIDLLMIAKYFERIGDHATNIAEWVEFSITGVHKGENCFTTSIPDINN